jgi:hypothetical protein
MGDYTPVFLGTLPVTFTASAAIVGGRPVEITGDMTVAEAAAGSSKVVGIAAFDCPSGQKLTVHTLRGSIEEVAVAAAVVAGDPLKAAGNGQVTKFVVGTDPEPARIGLCVKGQATVGSVCRYLTV